MNQTHYLVELKYLKKEEATDQNIERDFNQAKTQLEKYSKDRNLPSNTVKIVAITTNDTLLKLESI